MSLAEGGYLEDRSRSFYGQLYSQTKLWSGRRYNPEVRVEINVEPFLFIKQPSETRIGLRSFSRNPLCSLADIFFLEGGYYTASNIDSFDARCI